MFHCIGVCGIGNYDVLIFNSIDVFEYFIQSLRTDYVLSSLVQGVNDVLRLYPWFILNTDVFHVVWVSLKLFSS